MSGNRAHGVPGLGQDARQEDGTVLALKQKRRALCWFNPESGIDRGDLVQSSGRERLLPAADV